MYLPEVPRYMALVTLWSTKEKSRKEYYICIMDHGVQVNPITDCCEKIITRVTTSAAKRVSQMISRPATTWPMEMMTIYLRKAEKVV